MAKQKDLAKIHVAASYFATQSRDIKQIARLINVSERTIRRWSKDDEWQKALEILGHDKGLSFKIKPKRDTIRDAGDLYDKAFKAYNEAIKNGEPSHSLARIVTESVGGGLTKRRVRNWVKKYGWRKPISPRIPEEQPPNNNVNSKQ